MFVLGTGRCGTVTFAEACGHLTNFTVGHESRADLVGPDRLAFPDQHIEVDNRLSWRLGSLRALDDAFFVHMVRDREATARSFLRRWDSTYRAAILRAFAHGIVMRIDDWPQEQRLGVCLDYVDTVRANVRLLLSDVPSMTVRLEHIRTDFNMFLRQVGAEGDLEAALAEWDVRHNASSA